MTFHFAHLAAPGLREPGAPPRLVGRWTLSARTGRPVLVWHPEPAARPQSALAPAAERLGALIRRHRDLRAV